MKIIQRLKIAVLRRAIIRARAANIAEIRRTRIELRIKTRRAKRRIAIMRRRLAKLDPKPAAPKIVPIGQGLAALIPKQRRSA